MSANDFRLGGFSPALESTDHFKIEKSYDLFIGGKWVKASKQIATTNPATGETLAKVGLAGKKEVNQAVRAARKSYDNVWSKMPAAERGKYLFRIARLIQERAREFAVIESMDGGKPIRESRDIDVPLAAAHFFYHAGWADKLNFAFPGRSSKSHRSGGAGYSMEFPPSDGRLEDCSGTCLWKYRCAKTS